MATTRQKREKRERASAKRRAEEHGSGDRSTLKVPEGTSFLKLKEGIKKVDILEFKAGEGNPWADKGQWHYERTFWIHRNIGPEQNSVVCPAKTAGKKCPICEARARMSRDPKADEDMIKDLAPKERQLFQLIDHSDRDKGIQLLEISHHNFGKRLDAEIRGGEDGEGIENFASHDNEGMTLKLGIAEDSFGGVTFPKVETIKFLPRQKPIDPDILDNVMCLDDLISVMDYDELKKLFLQQEEEDDDEDEKPKKKSSKKQRSDDEDEDEEEESGEESDDDEDEEDSDEADDEDEAEVGDTVKFTYKGKVYKGVIKRKREGLFHIKCSDRTEPHIVDPEDVTLVKKAEPDEDDDEPGETPPKKSQSKIKKGGPSKDTSDEDDDEVEEDSELDEGEDVPPPKKKGKPVKKPSKKNEDDDEDDDDLEFEDED